MSPGIEVELKLALVAPARLGALLAALPAPRAVVEQRNCYLVPVGAAILGEPVMVRVRENWRMGAAGTVRDSVLWTVKRRRTAAGGVFVADELEQPLAPERWEAFLRGEATLHDLPGPAPDALRAFGLDGPLRLQGEMRNRRHEVLLEGFLLEVDRTEFPDGTVEAEVEVETDDPEGARALVERVAAAAGVRVIPQTRTKYARFLAYGGAVR